MTLFCRCCEVRTQLCVACRAPLGESKLNLERGEAETRFEGSSGSPAAHRLSSSTDRLGELAETTRLP